MVKIIQISAIYNASSRMREVYGLGEDSELYIWRSGRWVKTA